MKYTKDELAIILTDSMMGLEYKHKKRILDGFLSPAKIFDDKQALKDAAFSVVDDSKAKTVVAAVDESYLNFVIDKYEKRGTKVVTYLSDDYPESLKNVDCPPLCLYANGNVGLLKERNAFAIVGSRKCLPDICALTKDFAEKLALAGVCLITGSAGGADTATIDGALASGKVVSVLAGGINHVYPEYNKRLIDKVEKNALVISEQPPDKEVKPWMFPVRNRIIAGLAKGVLIAGGKKDSGARHTATFALEGGKDVYAFPYSVGIATGELNNFLIKNGAYLCDDVNDILTNLGIEKTEEKSLDLEEDQLKIYQLIKNGKDGVDMLLNASGMKMYELAPVLTELEVGGFIVKLAGNTYKAKK